MVNLVDGGVSLSRQHSHLDILKGSKTIMAYSSEGMLVTPNTMLANLVIAFKELKEVVLNRLAELSAN